MKFIIKPVFLSIAILGSLLITPKAEAVPESWPWGPGGMVNPIGCFFHGTLFALVAEDESCPVYTGNNPGSGQDDTPDSHNCIERRPMYD